MSDATGEVTIYGAGMSGLVAAINLALRGFHVTVHEREPGYGGSRQFNPSTHVTPLDPVRTSEYIGIDISSVFHPVVECPAYFHETKLLVPVAGVYAVERGSRPSSLDTLLYGECQGLDIDFEFGSSLTKADLDNLPPRTIIACGLNSPAYDLLGIPHLKWEGWMSRGELAVGNMAWLWWDECVNEYGYFSAVNGYYYDQLFSFGPVGWEDLKKYRSFTVHHEGMEHQEWHQIAGVAPVASPGNPRLFWRDAVLCGTISGAMDPLLGFGISGALVTGKVAALATTDRDAAEAEFKRFNRHFKASFYAKKLVWSRFIRPNVSAISAAINLFGVQRAERLGNFFAAGHLHVKGAIPGFGPYNCS